MLQNSHYLLVAFQKCYRNKCNIPSEFIVAQNKCNEKFLVAQNKRYRKSKNDPSINATKNTSFGRIF